MKAGQNSPEPVSNSEGFSMPDLDDRIRNLVASAVADAPPAPELDTQRVPARRPQVNWVKRGSLALAALLAAGGGYAVLQPADEGNVDTGRDTTARVYARIGPARETGVTIWEVRPLLGRTFLGWATSL